MTKYGATRCFWVEPAGIAALYLRRASLAACPKRHHGHLARTYFGTCNCRLVAGQPEHHPVQFPPKHHPLWPRRCACGYRFTPEDDHQEDQVLLWRRIDTGQVFGPITKAPPGAMYDAFWQQRKGDDGMALVAVCPNGAHWPIDERAFNCSMPNEDRHRCWNRKGEPPDVTVGAFGYTCAGAGPSIEIRDYCGTLEDGVFSPG